MNPSLHQDSSIIQQLQQGDQQAIGLIYDKYGAALYGVVTKIVKSETIAEDVMQEAFVKIWKNATTYDSTKGKLFTWLLNIARNTAIDKIRSAKYRQSKRSVPIENSVSNDRNLSVETQIDHIGLKKVLDSLDEKYRIVIDLIYLQGYTQKEVEKELEIPLGTVKSRVRIAIRELRKRLGGILLLFVMYCLSLMN
ncbi:MAG: RNA polymerase sigma factor [Saprospiraceae bacterium]